MSRELVYTSVPRGLAPNSVGFCTVAATAGMSKPVRMALESLCSYEPYYGLSDPRAHLNPVNFAHTRISVAGQSFSVLSRVAACGTDYSGRSNKIAHHFLLSDGEQVPGGPAWMMRRLRENETFRSQWSGAAQELPEFDLRSVGGGENRPPAAAQNWKRLTGDAGWAGALAAAFRRNSSVPAFVIFEPGTDLLPLFEESLALLSPEERWKVGFSTYYSVLPAGCQYHWRGVVAGSPAANEIRRFPNATVIDLTSSLPQVASDEFAEAARTGRTPEKAQPTTAMPKTTVAAPTTEKSAAAMPVLQAVGGMAGVRRGKSPNVPILSDLDSVSPEAVEQIVRLQQDRNDRRTRERVLWVAAGLLLVVAALAVFLLVRKDSDSPNAVAQIEKEKKLNAEVSKRTAENIQLEQRLASQSSALATLEQEKKDLKVTVGRLTTENSKLVAAGKTGGKTHGAEMASTADPLAVEALKGRAADVIFQSEPVDRALLKQPKPLLLTAKEDSTDKGVWRFPVKGKFSKYQFVKVPESLEKLGHLSLVVQDEKVVLSRPAKGSLVNTSVVSILEYKLVPTSDGVELECRAIESGDKYKDIIDHFVFEMAFGEPPVLYQCAVGEVCDPVEVPHDFNKEGRDAGQSASSQEEISFPWPEMLKIRFENNVASAMFPQDDAKVVPSMKWGLITVSWVKKETTCNVTITTDLPAIDAACNSHHSTWQGLRDQEQEYLKGYEPDYKEPLVELRKELFNCGFDVAKWNSIVEKSRAEWTKPDPDKKKPTKNVSDFNNFLEKFLLKERTEIVAVVAGITRIGKTPESVIILDPWDRPLKKFKIDASKFNDGKLCQEAVEERLNDIWKKKNTRK